MRKDRRSGVVLAMVLILCLLLSTAVITFSGRSVVDSLIARNRDRAAQAEALARGGIQLAIGLILEDALADRADEGSGPTARGDTLDDVWARIGETEFVTPQGTLRVQIRDNGARLNLNALVDYAEGDSGFEDQTDAEEFLAEFLEKVMDGMGTNPSTGGYDTARELGRNLIDYIDPDHVRFGGRGDEDDYYQRQSPPYRAANRPLLSIEELALIEGFDAELVRALTPYVTVYPPVGAQGININTAPPHVLTAVYHGTSGDRRLVKEGDVERILKLRENGLIICDQTEVDPDRCVAIAEVLEGSIYPPVALPSSSSVFTVIAEAEVGGLYRTLEAVIDRGEADKPRVLTWRYR